MSLLNYIKQIWDTTSYVNPTRMNHIEEGIYAVSDKVDNLDDSDVKHGDTTVNSAINDLMSKVVFAGTATDIGAWSNNGGANISIGTATKVFVISISNTGSISGSVIDR